MKRSFLLFLLSLSIGSLNAQWLGYYGNSWIDYSQPYARIAVKQNGVQKLERKLLPEVFRTAAPDMLQLWYRGKEVAILKADADQILFYGVSNDGASDSLMYRPVGPKFNPFLSRYSEEGSYFLTVGKTKGKRAEVITSKQKLASPVVAHVRRDIVTYKEQFAQGTYTVGGDGFLLNSFFEPGKTWVGQTYVGSARENSAIKDSIFIHKFETDKLVKGTNIKRTLEVAIAGLMGGKHDIDVEVSPTATGSYRSLGRIQFTGFGGRKLLGDLRESDFSATGEIYLRIESKTNDLTDWYGISHLVLTYPRELDASGKDFSTATLAADVVPGSPLQFKNSPPALTYVLDVSDIYQPRNLPFEQNANGFEVFTAGLGKGRELSFASDKTINIGAKQIRAINFKSQIYSSVAAPRATSGTLDPLATDFLMITSDTLLTSSTKYAEYRASKAGGANRVLLVNIRDIYDEFNYGEASPLAIRRFVDYMLSKGIRTEKHNLLLFGLSITYSTRIVPEMPNEVPTYGDPGSDILLVAGLAGKGENIAAIPVGRLAAFSDANVMSYLNKLKTFESGPPEAFWKKKVLHMNGGHSSSELILLKSILQGLENTVENSDFGGVVMPLVKKQGVNTSEKIDISPEVNDGVGMITFFGHGSQNKTDLDFGSVKDASRGFVNNTRFPLMYFNGCGVGNVFTSRVAPGLAGEWIFTDSRGAMAMVGNSYLSFVSPSQRHLNAFYKYLFQDGQNHSLGQLVNMAAEAVMGVTTSTYDVANIHQINILGDPSLRFHQFNMADFLIEDSDIKIHSEDTKVSLEVSKNIVTKIAVKNGGRFLKGKPVDLDVVFLYEGGSEKREKILLDPLANLDTVSITLPNNGKLTKVVAKVNSNGALQEYTLANNAAEILIDWEEAKKVSVYPQAITKDLIAPQISVYFDNRIIQNREYVAPNPLISVLVQDDRLMFVDTSAIEIFYRDCAEDKSCDFVPLPESILKNAKLNLRDDYTLELEFRGEEMVGGDYELMILAKDKAGNLSTAPFYIRFRVNSEISSAMTRWLTVSPNPASNIVKFALGPVSRSDFQSVQYQIYDLNGKLRHEEIQTGENIKARTFYYPSPGDQGLHLYQVIFTDSSGKVSRIGGRLLIQN